MRREIPNKLTHENEIFVHIVDFHETGAHEAVTPNDDGTYSIFLNARDSHEQQMESYYHALSHIFGDDFYRDDLTVTQIERIRHNHDERNKNTLRQMESVGSKAGQWQAHP